MKLTGQERVNRMFARRDHDRVPRHDSFWAETIARWQKEGLTGGAPAALERLQNDFHSLNWLWPMAFPGREEVVSMDAETRVLRDGNGRLARHWRNKSGTPDHLGFECDSRAKWENVFKPALLATGLQLDPAAIAKEFQTGRAGGRWCHLTGVESFEETRSLMGDEITLMAMVEDPDWVRDVSKTFTDVMLVNLNAALATGITPDGLWIYGDMAFKTSTMCSPQMYRDLIWPDHKRLADWAHAHNLKFIYHTDGDVNGVLDMYIAAGFDCLQPLECKASMDLRRLAPQYGKQLAFFGNMDVMILMTNDRARIEAEVKAKLAAGMATKGYIYHSDHSVPPQVSWETYQFIIALLDKYGRY